MSTIQAKILICLIAIGGLVTNTSASLQAQVPCVTYEYGNIPVAAARKLATAADLKKKGGSLLSQFKLGGDLMISSIVTYLITIIPGAVYYSGAQKEFDRYCKLNDCKCANTRPANKNDYWLPLRTENPENPEALEQRLARRSTVGQVYFHYPSFGQFGPGRLYNPFYTELIGSIFTFGFSVTVGAIQKPQHLADIGVTFDYFSYIFNLFYASNRIAVIRLGYVYHWSSKTHSSAASHNFHVGTGISYLENDFLDAGGVGFQSSAGLYLRFSYFIEKKLKRRRITKRYRASKRFRSIIYGVNLEGQLYPNRQEFNNSAISFIVGLPFSH